MTNVEALKAKMYPYELPEDTMELLLVEQGLQSSGTFDISALFSLVRATIRGLYQVITLKKEQDNGSTIEYDVDKILDLIKRYKKDINEEDETKPRNIDKTRYW